MRYSILIPIYNNFVTIPFLYNRIVNAVRLFKFEVEFVFINDASSDTSLTILLELQKQDERIKIIDALVNYGQANAFYIGLKYATGNYFIFISGDLQEDELIVQKFILKSIENPVADLIIGVRETNSDFIFFRLFSSLFYFILHLKFSNMPKKGFDIICINAEIAQQFLNNYHMKDFVQTQLLNLSKQTDSISYHRQSSQDKSFKLKSILFKIHYFIQGLKQLFNLNKLTNKNVLAKEYDFKIKQIIAK